MHLNIHNADRGGPICGMDARAKVVFTAFLMVAVLISKNPVLPMFAGGVCLMLLLAARVRPAELILRLLGPMFFAGTFALFQAVIFKASGKPAATALLTISHSFGCVMAVLFLSMTTPAHRLLSAAAWLRLPKGLCELMLISYRYLFVLIEDAVRVHQAQRGRLGYSSVRRGLTSIGTLCGAVFLRAYAQAEATGISMAMRGYTGEYIPVCRERFRPFDVAFLCAGLTSCAAVLIWTS